MPTPWMVMMPTDRTREALVRLRGRGRAALLDELLHTTGDRARRGGG
ncbi:hypothetical protein [Streptomyces sp. NPDC003635]